MLEQYTKRTPLVQKFDKGRSLVKEEVRATLVNQVQMVQPRRGSRHGFPLELSAGNEDDNESD